MIQEELKQLSLLDPSNDETSNDPSDTSAAPSGGGGTPSVELLAAGADKLSEYLEAHPESSRRIQEEIKESGVSLLANGKEAPADQPAPPAADEKQKAPPPTAGTNDGEEGFSMPDLTMPKLFGDDTEQEAERPASPDVFDKIINFLKNLFSSESPESSPRKGQQPNSAGEASNTQAELQQDVAKEANFDVRKIAGRHYSPQGEALIQAAAAAFGENEHRARTDAVPVLREFFKECHHMPLLTVASLEPRARAVVDRVLDSFVEEWDTFSLAEFYKLLCFQPWYDHIPEGRFDLMIRLWLLI